MKVPDTFPAFCQMIRLGDIEGPRLTPHTISYDVPWRWTGNPRQAVRLGGKHMSLGRAIYMLFSEQEPVGVARVRRRRGTDPNDFRPQNFYCLLTNKDFTLSEFAESLLEMGVESLSEVDPTVYFDLSPDDVRLACQQTGVAVDVELGEDPT